MARVIQRVGLLVLWCFAGVWVASLVACAPSTGPQAGTADEVKIQLVSLGLKGRGRPGEWVGVLLQITDTANTPREVVVQWPVMDADGDTATYRRAVTTNPGVKMNVWLYGRLPFRFSGSVETEFQVVAADETKPGTAGVNVTTAGAGKLLGRLPQSLTTGNLADTYIGQWGIVGRPVSGLDLYSVMTTSNRAVPKGHEPVELLDGLRVVDLPDRWMGLSQIPVLVWSNPTGDGDPASLTESQATAVREWLQRGGHLVIVMPLVGQGWLAPTNKLIDVMPRVTIERDEGVDLTKYAPLLRDAEQQRVRAALPKGLSIQNFKPLEGIKPGDAVSILDGPDGGSVVSRRLVGAGAVTLIGLPLASPAMAVANAVQPDVFWHRVIGRRGALLTTQSLQELIASGKFYEARDPVNVDDGLGASIAKTGEAAKGVLLAFGVFVAYWLLAGPLAFRTLKGRKQTQHAWVAFVLMAGVFTGLAWGGAWLLKPTKTEAQHLTFLDDVYGQNTQHARGWASVLLPRFGNLTIGIQPEEGSAQSVHNTAASWEPAAAAGLGIDKFPDARAYGVEAAAPADLRVPARSTVKTVQLDWMGAPRWKTPIPLPDAPVRMVRNVDSAGRAYSLEGKLQHDLPGSLKNVRVIVVYQQFNLGTGAKETILANTASVVVPEWKAKTPLDLGTLFGVTTQPPSSLDAVMTGLVPALGEGAANRFVNNPRGGRRGASTAEEGERVLSDERLTALSFFSMLPPPMQIQGSSSPLARRQSAQGVDLSRWITQPCIIVVGLMSDEGPTAVSGGGGECPIPLTVEGELIPTRGKTVVRWVMPLGSNPPRAPSAD